MYPIDTDTKNEFMTSKQQVVLITIGEDTLDESDVIQGGLSVNRYCSSGDRIEIGSCIAAEASITFDNHDNRFNDFRFAGEEMYIELGVEVDGDISYMPLGYFTVDDAPRKLAQINISALDRMMLFDKKINPDLLVFPMTVEDLLDSICEICEVDMADDYSSLTNMGYTITNFPEGVSTYRDLLSCIAEITGTCAYIDYNGELVLQWYEDTDEVITIADRYTSDIYESPITITGVQVIHGQDVYVAGTEGHVITVSDNPLIQSDWQTIADRLNEHLSGFSYTPFTADVVPMPYLYPLDMITFRNQQDANILCAVTDVTVKMNGGTSLKGRGVPNERLGYGRDYSYTADQAKEISRIDDLEREQTGYYEYRNSSAISIADEEIAQLFRLQLVSNTNTNLQIHCEVNLETMDTDADSVTIAAVTYEVDGETVTAITPTETYIDGKHIMHLMYILPLERYQQRFFIAYMEAGGGTIEIPAYGIWLSALGNGLVVQDRWDGILFITEHINPVTLSTSPIVSVTPITETVSISAREVQMETFSETVHPVTLSIPAVSVLPIEETVIIGRQTMQLEVVPSRASEYTAIWQYINVTPTAFVLRTDYTYQSQDATTLVDRGHMSYMPIFGGQFQRIDSISITATPPVPQLVYRTTEDGADRTTEDGQNRITEDR